MNWIGVAYNTAKCRSFVNIAMNLAFS